MHSRLISLFASFVLLSPALPARAQTVAASSTDGRRRLVAVEITGPMTLDGALDEAVWQQAQPADGFVQAEPHEGQPATESTKVRVAFDRTALYVGVYCHDSEADGLIVNDIRKDFVPENQDSFSVLLDTFADRRNGFVFVTNPEGAKADTQIANEGREVNTNWDAVWDVKAKRLADGWSAELRIPFKTLRFESGPDRLWGINFARRVRRKNELDYWSPVPRSYSIYRASLGGDLAGLPDVSQGRNLRIKPFALAGATRATGGSRFDKDGSVGFDLKYGVTPALTLDLTVRPDFAQAEADEQQVNLTQFSLFYPEKREFFLENSGVFYFGDIPRNVRNPTRFRPPEEEVLLFFSRRIGLTDNGQQIPIAAGGRLTGRAAGMNVGLLTIQTRTEGALPGNNYSVFRTRRDVLRNSDIGAIFLSRQSSEHGSDYNRVAGLDANFRFFRYLSLNSFISRSMTEGVEDGQWAGKASIGWEDNRVHGTYSFLSIGDNFRDDIGFIRRKGIQKHFYDAGWRPRPQALRRHGIRELHPHIRLQHWNNREGGAVSATDHIAQTIDWDNGMRIELALNPRLERIFVPFKVHPTTTIPAGRYDWNEYEGVLETDKSRLVYLTARLTFGGFWDGTQRSQRAAVVIRPSHRLILDVGIQRSDINLRTPAAEFVTNIVNARGSYAFSTSMFLDSLLQYNRDLRQFNANVRFNLIHHPLSDLYVVYNEQRFTDVDTPAGRGLIVKFTQMMSF